MPEVHIEFYGIPQKRMGCSKLTIKASTIADVLLQLAAMSPEFEKSCLINGQLRSEFLISINGQEFTRDSDYLLNSNHTVLILNADVGG